MLIGLTGYAHPFSENGGYYGAERMVYYLAAELKKRGHECVIFSVKGCDLPSLKYVPIEKCWDDKIDLYYEAVKKYEQDNNVKFDMIHSFQASGFIDTRFREEHNYCLEPFMSFGKDHPGHWAENIIAYSERLNHINGGQSTTIYLGLPEELYEFSEIEDNYMVWCGRMDPGKCPHTAIEIAKRVGMKIILMGPPYHYPYFVDKVWPHVNNEDVIWLRGVNDSIKKKVLKRATVFVTPIWDQYHEMFGIATVEALACGTPVIAWNNVDQPSAVGWNEEIFKNGVHGFIINHSMYSDSEREKAIVASVEAVKNIKSISRKACRELFLSKFSSKITADKCLKYYNLIRTKGKVLNVTNEL